MTALRPIQDSRDGKGIRKVDWRAETFSSWEAQVNILGLWSAISKLRTEERLADAYSTS